MRGIRHHLSRSENWVGLHAPVCGELTITAAAKSVQGLGCEANEDCYRLDEHRGVFVIANGAGGSYGRQRASRLAVNGLMHEAQLLFDQQPSAAGFANSVAQAFHGVNASILTAATNLPRLHGMRASAVMAIAAAGRIYVAGVGDCRTYLIRGDEAQRMTNDQTLFQLMSDAGLDVTRDHDVRSPRLVWTCLGDRNLEPPHVRWEEIQHGDRLILVSNGVTRVVKDGLLQRLSTTNKDPVAMAAAVVNAARTLKTRDEATCVTVEFQAAGRSSH